MIDNSRIKLENKKEYIVIDKIESDGKIFIYLSNVEDDTDICVRKQIEEEEKNYLVGLENREEADYALELFNKKHAND